MSDFEEMIGEWGDRYFDPKGLGGWSPMLEAALERFKSLSAKRSAQCAAPEHKVAIGWTEDKDFNAFAGTTEAGDLIAIAVNVPVSLSLLFRRVLLFKEFLPFLEGLPYDQVEPAPLPPEGLLFSLDHGPSHVAGDHGPLRGRLANFMTQIALDYVFMHELGHIWNGHTSLMKERYGLGIVEEIERDNNLPVSAIDRQTIEMDADCFAARHMSTAELLEREWLPANPAWEAEFGENSTYTIIRNIAIYLALRCFNEAASLVDMGSRFYPPVAVRQFYVAGTWFAAMSKDKEKEFSEFGRMIVPIIQAGEEAFSFLTGKPVDAAGAKLAYSREGIDYGNTLLRNWARLRPQLDPLKRGGTLAPIQSL
ncbi:hypothetical protein [Rhizobium leguminosarum]|uniref:hypothetical protein n=1 Tax=Rhizobium leguminosarum TaxID=384 RepID=UPI0013B6AAB8|nr:hypothetical protein [Rhizobium leguminosarum]MBY5319187.1 hypothetical protein [Rhizobium leguminosarum]MBY5380585.1 hypothetical protein [Rhizobium leguminosarum]NEH69496.1 hypothetical protein [Rhizobium leguminosarum]